jgi:hypothetical protein
MKNNLLLHALSHPDCLQHLSLRDWDQLLPLVRKAGVMGRIYFQLADRGQLECIPPPVLPHLEAAAIIAIEHERMLRWEVNRIQRALIDTTISTVLLKGAAYVLADLPCARGRMVADVDFMVPKDKLTRVEQALRSQGWEPVKLDEYDQSYYRRWMHELPPLRHRLRGTVVDVHHTILPETSRLKPNPALLLMNAQTIGNGRLQVLAPADMVLHAAAHTFHDGELSHSLRDLVDLHALLCHFGTTVNFWEDLLSRARILDLERPLFYTLRYTRRLLGTPVPDPIMAASQDLAPLWPVRMLMDRLVNQTLSAQQASGPGTAVAGWLLYLRSHWLRMPPLLLTRHLLRKAGKRLQYRSTGLIGGR